MEPNTEIFFEHDRWGHNVAWSVALHFVVAGCIVFYAAVVTGGRRETWGIGGTGEAMGVTLVNTVPLPANEPTLLEKPPRSRTALTVKSDVELKPVVEPA